MSGNDQCIMQKSVLGYTIVRCSVRPTVRPGFVVVRTWLETISQRNGLSYSEQLYVCEMVLISP